MKHSIAREWLKKELESGEVERNIIVEKAASQSIAPRTMERAAKQIGVKSRREGDKWWWGLQVAADGQEQVEYLRAKNRQLENANKDLRKTVGEQQEIGFQIAEAIKAADPFPKRSNILITRSKPVVVPVVVFSDWHIGEVVNKNETEGFGEYNYGIAQDRLFGILDDFLKWVEVNRKAYCITECAVFCLGDYISGNIHHELSVTNEFPLPVQTAKAGLLLGETFKILAPHFDKVQIEEQGADNHGRLTHKPQKKQKNINNMSYLVHQIANLYAAKHDNLMINEAEGMKKVAEVNGRRFLLEHGDEVKAHMGFPWYGLSREKGREALRRMNVNALRFHYQAIGHWHVPSIIEGNTFVNGSLCGTTEYDHANGRHAGPAQVAFMIHREHGVFNFTPFSC